MGLDPATFVDATERERARTAVPEVNFYREALEQSQKFRADYENRLNVVKWDQMPMERSADGLIKHVINERMDTKECCVDVFMQFIEAGKATGTSRHLSEEIAFVIEGTGHDLHYDVHFECKVEFEWTWDTTPKKYEWGPGDFIYIP
ncbi:MAG: cupin, partial [Alphaproteobacteria bacterium]|nr:cupin [Alphaproteobacteria bacterium]